MSWKGRIRKKKEWEMWMEGPHELEGHLLFPQKGKWNFMGQVVFFQKLAEMPVHCYGVLSAPKLSLAHSKS
jgi:hypothetical protein